LTRRGKALDFDQRITGMATRKPKTILLVEDERIIAMAQSATIRRFGYDVVEVFDGNGAVSRATEASGVDLVLMDIDLGEGIDGTEAARRILARRNVPIVFLTSHAEREMVERVRGITRYGYVIKDSGDFVLQSSIEMAFELYDAHERVSESESRQRTLLWTIPDLVWLKDEDGVYLSCNPHFERFFGAPEAEIVGKTDYDFLDKGKADFFREYDRKAIEADKPNVNEEWITFASDGHRAFLETIKTPMKSSDGRLIGVLGIARDITERKRAEDKLSATLQQMYEIIEFLPDPTFVIDQERKVVAWNMAMEELTGAKKEEMLGQGDYAYSLPFYRERRPILIDLIDLTTDELEAKYDYVRRVDTRIYAETYIAHLNRGAGANLWGAASPLFDSTGKRIGAIEVIRDISERTKTERELVQSNYEKELLLKEVQHRIQNTLAIISSFLSLEMDKCKDEYTRAVFQDAMARIRTISRLYQSLYQASGLNSINLRQYIREMSQQLLDSYTLRPGAIRLSFKLDEISFDMKRAMNIGLILNELLINALKYAFLPGEEGTIRIELSRNEDSIVLLVADDGKGMGTDGQGDGVKRKGIGLHIVDMLAKELGGSFHIENDSGTIARLVIRP
jgi:two-component system, sensor histidine kinase PdtaS